jgi:ribosomal protein S18 acetylase RimI-like enzyme
VVQDASLEELDEVSNLLRDSYLQYKPLVPSDIWEPYLKDIMNVRRRLKESELIVAKLNGNMAGAVTLYLNAISSAQERWPEGWAGIRLLAVCPEYRGRGVGRALMEECFERCKKARIATIGLHTTEAMDIARRMYERMGFSRVPEFDFHPRPNMVVMAYRLQLDSKN